MDQDPRVEENLREMIRLLLQIPDADLPEFREDPYDNRMRIKISSGLRAGHTGPGLLLHVLAQMDGKDLNQFRQRHGQKWRQDITKEFLNQYDTRIGLHFTYSPYTGITQKISQDWTRLYDGIRPIGHLKFFFSEEDRDAALYDEDTKDPWPEDEIWACTTEEALFHILRLQQRTGLANSTGIAYCNCNGPCESGKECRKADTILGKVYQDFLKWSAEEQQ